MFTNELLTANLTNPNDFSEDLPTSNAADLAAWLSDEPSFGVTITDDYANRVTVEEVECRLSPLDGYPDAVAEVLFGVLTAIRSAARGDTGNANAAVLLRWLTGDADDTAAERAVRHECGERMTEFTGDAEAVVAVTAGILHAVRVAFQVIEADADALVAVA